MPDCIVRSWKVTPRVLGINLEAVSKETTSAISGLPSASTARGDSSTVTGERVT